LTDKVDRKTRSRMMAAIGREHTRPEIIVRRYLHACGLRFRLHDKNLPGSPDIVFAAHRVAVYVHGCFWHQHPGCCFAATPATNVGFWAEKFQANSRRDDAAIARLTELGWVPLVIWECEARDMNSLDGLFWRIQAESYVADWSG
jgi:DNA mismatch endonuclease (patch repair protein)